MELRGPHRRNWPNRYTDVRERSVFWHLGSVVCNHLSGSQLMVMLTLNFNRCWITSQYPQEQIFLEYFLVRTSPCLRESSYILNLTSQEYLSAGFCLILYTSVFLRMRGNLVHAKGKWSLRFLPRGESWQLSMSRDLIDSAMLQVRSSIITPVRFRSINLCFVGRSKDAVVSFSSIYSVEQP